MHLNPNACADHFCHQVGGNYFQSTVAHQRGYGLFGDVIRFITPLVTKAGKYFGKHLLSTGKNLIEDVARGSEFKTAAKKRLRETGRRIKDDILQKLQTGSGKRGIKRKSITIGSQLKAKTRQRKPDIFTRKK